MIKIYISAKNLVVSRHGHPENHPGNFRADPDEKLRKFRDPDFPQSTGNFAGGYSRFVRISA